MIKNIKKAGALIEVIIGVFILSIIIIGIGVIMGTSKDLIDRFDKKMDLELLTKNSYNIINTLDLSSLEDGDVFYLFRNKSNNKFEIFKGEHNNECKFVDKYGDKIDDINNFNGDIFERSIIFHKININGFNNFYFDLIINKYISN